MSQIRAPAEKLISKNRRRRIAWQRFVRSLAIIVVFCTTYALILPAITMHSDTICGMQSHIHGEGCYEVRGIKALTCTHQEGQEHGDACWTETGEMTTELVCAIPEHTHGDGCYPVEPEATLGVIYHCGFGEHTHGEGCTDSDGNLTCRITEHTHTAVCAVETLDLTADMESSEVWEGMVSRLNITGTGRQDLLTIAKSQIDYSESRRNCVLMDGVLNGYTRYGDWYGNAYQPWDDVFVSFCLFYAGISDDVIPRESDTGRWIDLLGARNLLADGKSALPQPGDIVFCKNSGGQIYPAILLEYATENTNLDALQYRVIAGDVDDRVATVSVNLNDIVAVCDPDNALEQYTQRLDGVSPDTEEFGEAVESAGDEAEATGNTTGPTENPDEEASASESLPGFSDSVVSKAATVADKYQFVTVNPNQLQEGVDYVIYTNYTRRINAFRSEYTLNFLVSDDHPNGDLHSPLQLAGDVKGNAPYTVGSSWSLTATQMGTTDSDLFTWRVVKRNGNTYLVNQQTKQELYFYNGWFHLVNAGSSESTPVSFATSGAGAYVRDSRDSKLGLRFDYSSEGYKWRGIWTGDGGSPNDAATVYFARVDAQGRQFPHAVHTGTVDIDRLRFYNLCENGDKGVSPLAGCVFEITGANGYKATVVSGNNPELHLPSDIPDGQYTITEISAPDGYVRDARPQRTFVVEDGALVSDRTIGTFLNHNMEQLQAGKTAEVENYAERIYQVDLTAKSNMRHFAVEPIELLFVVDQSNSMLFPSGLVDTGKRVRLQQNGGNNVNNMNALNLDKSKVHYVIADPTGTSTVWAVWWDGSTWMCQDASYYAKAKHANEPGYQDDNETVIFPEDRSYADQRSSEPSGTRSNGAGLGRDLTGSTLGTHLEGKGGSDTFVVYTATNEFNRLHYLEEAMVNLLYQMADVNDQNRVSLTRFTRVVDPNNDCYGPVTLSPDNVEDLAEKIQKIKTSGGTRQDIALQHIYEDHLSDGGKHQSDFDHTYTLLITDGAPVYNSGTGPTSLGGPNDTANINGSTVYGRIKGWAAEVRKKSTLMTVGLGMESVEAGKQVLKEIATNENYFCALDDASKLLTFIQRVLLDSFTAKEYIDYYGDITDEISDSFYPVAWVNRGAGNGTGNRVLVTDSTKDWVLLEENDWITLDGKLTVAGASDAAGQLLRKADGTFYVKWTNQKVSGNTWHGTVYIKAKEDFIGGNAIDTNKDAEVTVDGSGKHLDTPTVNVRLLDMNELNSEVTVYLGDQVNGEGDAPLDSLRYFWQNTRFRKLISDGGSVLNKVSANGINGLEDAVFYLRYAMGRDLTEEEWERLVNGDAIVVEYTYDDNSSHGPVGSFTFRLEKDGLGSAYQQHEAISTCQPGGQPLTGNCTNPAETYTLHITYQAYGLGENGRPERNVYNGGSGPGREVGTGSTPETGLGILTKQNVHEVHVISGRIEIIKKFDDGVTDAADRTFTFTLHRVEDGTDTSRDITETITIPANASAGAASILFDNLRRGTYTVTEAVDDAYALKSITVLGSTNSYSEPAIGGSATTLVAVMGNDVENRNVIGKANAADRYTSYISPVNGVYCAAEFTNAPIVYSAEIPVEKIWDDGAENHLDEAVYVVLYLEDSPLLDGDRVARILRLDAQSGWKGSFTVTLSDKEDSLDHYNYSIREADQVRQEFAESWHPAILENDGSALLYYDRVVESGRLFTLNGKGYVMEYATGDGGKLTVTNYRAVELPNTGGTGTAPLYTFGSLLITAAAFVYGYNRRRKKERGVAD